MFDLLGHVPAAGEAVTVDGLRLVADRVNGRRIERVRIAVNPEPRDGTPGVTAFRSGFAAVTGRPNVGKSTLVNAMVGEKVTVVSTQPNTTRTTVRGVVHRPDAQLVLIDTPGVHKPKTALGGRMNDAASGSLDDVDVVVAVVDATAAVGPGDRMVLERSLSVLRRPSESALARSGEADTSGAALMVVVNKVDRARRDEVLGRLTEAARVIDGLEAAAGQEERLAVEYFPVSALTGEGVASLLEAIVERLPEGPEYYPPGMVARDLRSVVGGRPGARGAAPTRSRTSSRTASPAG